MDINKWGKGESSSLPYQFQLVSVEGVMIRKSSFGEHHNNNCCKKEKSMDVELK